MAENDVENELLDYEEDEEPQGAPENAAPVGQKEVKGSYVSIHSSGFRDFLLKPELLRAIIDCGFEHPSEGEGYLAVFLVVCLHVFVQLGKCRVPVSLNHKVFCTACLYCPQMAIKYGEFMSLIKICVCSLARCNSK